VEHGDGQGIDDGSEDPSDMGEDPGDPEEVVTLKPEGDFRIPAGYQSQQSAARL
jgi:hypothetical protein